MTEELKKLLENPEEVKFLSNNDPEFPWDEIIEGGYLKEFKWLEHLSYDDYYNNSLKDIWSLESLDTLWLGGIDEKDLNDNILKFKGSKFGVERYYFSQFPKKILQSPYLLAFAFLQNDFATIEYYFKIRLNIEATFQQHTNQFNKIDFYNWGVVISDQATAYISYNPDDLVWSAFEESSISINITGNHKEAQKLLQKIKHILISENKDYYKDKGFFYYKKSNWKEISFDERERSEVDYQKLISLKKANRYYYENYYENWLVDDLLEYILGKEGRKQLEKEIEEEVKSERVIFESENSNPLVTEIRFRDFKVFSESSIELKQLNVAIGKNGTGKTTFLQGLAMSLVPKMHQDLPKYLHPFIRKEESFADITTAWGKYERNIKIYGSAVETVKTFIPTPFVFAYSANMFHNSQLRTDSLIKDLNSGEGEVAKIDSLFDDYSTSFFDPTLILNELNVYSQRNTYLVDYLRITINLFLQIPEIENLEINNNFNFADAKGNIWLLNELSEGYRNNILLVSDMVFRIFAARKNIFTQEVPFNETFDKATGMILIDEFDRHLHPAWQRRFVGKLREVFPKVQFVLTTHNILSVQSAVGGNAIILKDNNCETKTIKNKNILNIVREFFTSDIYEPETQNLVNELNNDYEKIYSENKSDIVYSSDFRNKIKALLAKGTEFEQIVAMDLAQLNEHLTANNQNPFELYDENE